MIKEFRVFHNRLRILRNIDHDEFGQAAGYGDTRDCVPDEDWRKFRDNPYTWFIQADTDKSQGVFEYILGRESRA